MARQMNPPTNGVEGSYLAVRVTSASGDNRTFSFDSAIVLPADWSPVFPKALTAGKTYLVRLYHNGTAWEIVKVDEEVLTPILKNASFRAENDKRYHVTATCTVSDPPGVEGRGYEVIILAGTVTVGGTPYTGAGKFLRRVYSSGSWSFLPVMDSDALNAVLTSAGYIPQSALAAGIYDFLTGATTLAETVPQRFGVNYRPILRRVRNAMSMARESLSILVIGDSMGDTSGTSTTTGRWVSQVAYRIAALYPAYNVVHKIYNQGSGNYDTYAVQTGSSGARCLNFPSGNLYGNIIPVTDMIAPTTGDADVRVRFSINAYTGLATGVLAAEFGNRWRLMVTSAKTLVFTWFNSSGGFNQASSSAYTNADDTPIWVRVTMEGNSGGSNVVKFYTSTNGTTWSQLGSTQTNPWTTGVQTMNTTNQSVEVGGRGLSSEPLKGAKIYEVQVLDGVAGPPRCPMCPDAALWQGYGTPGTNAATLAGSPTLTINNASVYGYSIAGLLALTNVPWLRNDGRGCTILAQGYNNAEDPSSFKAQLDACLTAVRARRPLDNLLVVIEPFSSANTALSGEHYVRDMWRRGVLQDWTTRNNFGALDMHGVFVNAGGALFSDDIHPNATGNQLWATTFMSAFGE